MTESDPFRRYVEAGIALTQLTRAKAERIVRDLVKAGELQREQAQERVEELLERSRKSSEGLLGVIRNEISQQLSSLGLATKQDLDDLERRVEGRMGSAAPSSPGATTKTTKTAKTTKAATATATARPSKAGGPTATAAAKKPAKGTKAAQETAATTPPPGSAARTARSPKASRRPSGSGPASPADAT